VEEPGGGDCVTPLFTAVKYGRAEIAQVLLEAAQMRRD
jgi:hypothetical protein